MEYIYDKIISNSLNEKDKQQIKLVFEKYNNRLQKYKDIVDKATPKRESLLKEMVEDIKPKSRGRPKKDYTEEEIEALKQKTRDIAKRHYENNFEKGNFKKQNGQKIIES